MLILLILLNLLAGTRASLNFFVRSMLIFRGVLDIDDTSPTWYSIEKVVRDWTRLGSSISPPLQKTLKISFEEKQICKEH